MDRQYQVVSLNERHDLYEKQQQLTAQAWPEFIRHDDVSDIYWMRMIELFQDYQVLLTEQDEILSIVTAVPLHYTGEVSALPDEGWDWIIRKSVEDAENRRAPTLLAGIQIVINPKHQGKGLSYAAVKEMAALAKQKGLSQLIIPVRPSMKSGYPLVPIDEYLKWRDKDSHSMDPWLRVHEKCGGKQVRTCSKSMKITGSVKEWEEWTGREFPMTGQYVIERGLVPLEIDIEQNKGCYVEPNVWFVHQTVTSTI